MPARAEIGQEIPLDQLAIEPDLPCPAQPSGAVIQFDIENRSPEGARDTGLRHQGAQTGGNQQPVVMPAGTQNPFKQELREPGRRAGAPGIK